MGGVSRKSLAALLVLASLTAPGVALASDPVAPAPVTAPVPPAKEGTTLAEFKVTQEQAIAAAVKLFEIPTELGQPNVSRSQSRDYAAWNLQWQTPAKQVERVSITVEVDGLTGEVRSYNRSEVKLEQRNELNYSRSEAYEVAAQWLDKLAGDLKDQLRYKDNPAEFGYYGGADATYNFRWNRMEQGYPVAGDGIAFGVDARTGQMVYYRREWRPNLTFALPGQAISQAKAEEAYREVLAELFQLQYNQYYQPGTEEAEWRLVYRPLAGYPLVDMDGKVIDQGGTAVNLERVKDFTLVSAAEKPYTAPAKPLTEAEALAIARAVSGRTDAPTDVSYGEYGEADAKRHQWDFSWYASGELQEGEFNTNVTINAVTGMVVSFGNWGPYRPLAKDEKPKVSQAEARAIAINFIRNHRPDLAGQVMVTPSWEDSGAAVSNWGIRFVSLKNGIVVAGQNIYADVDAQTGQIRSFYFYDEVRGNQEFPAAEGLQEPAKVADAFLKHIGLEATWLTMYPTPAPVPTPRPLDATEAAEAPKPETRLVFAPVQGMSFDALDATSGAPLDYQGRDLVEAAKRPTDIDGHYAQREIELLWARGIFTLKGGKFNPEQTITAAELARWLVLAKGMRPYVGYDFYRAFDGMGAGAATFAAKLESSADNAYFGAAMQSGIFLPEDFDLSTDPDAVVSRELFALWAVRAMGYGSIASMPNRIEMSFADKDAIGAKYANAVAILQGLGAVKGTGSGIFAPKGAITRGEAAKILFTVASETRR